MIYNGWTDSEICMLYRQAKNKENQIVILTQLTGLRKIEVEKILEEGGYLTQMTDLVKERILQLYKQELSDTAIAKELSLAQSQVSTFLRKKGLPPNGKKIQKKNEIQEGKEVPQENMQEVKTVQPEIKKNLPEIIETLKRDTQKNVDELKDILPKSIPAGALEPKDEPMHAPIDFDVVETLTPQQYYELAKLTIELLKTIWG